jgi:signal transduction histidine kinase
VFDRFRQDRATVKRGGGLGLGLAVVRNLTEMHGGSVKAFSEGEGKGSTFTVSLPLAKNGDTNGK